MGDFFEVDTEQLRNHAGQVHDVAGHSAQALDAAHQMMPGFDMAYGLICQFFPPMLHPVQQRGVDAIQNATDALRSLAANLEATATGYETTEQHATQLFTELISRLEGVTVPDVPDEMH